MTTNNKEQTELQHNEIYLDILQKVFYTPLAVVPQVKSSQVSFIAQKIRKIWGSLG